MSAPDLEVVTVRSRNELRRWLSDNHRSGCSVWLASFKTHTDHDLPYEEIVRELLCWGWIDSRTKKMDDDRSAILIAPRNPKSAWSAINKAHVEAARAAGAMMPAGEALIEAAKASGMWSFLDDVERLETPDDLSARLEEEDLSQIWDTWPRSVRRGTLEWIKTAKTPDTRAKRIADVVASAGEGKRPSPFRR